MRAARWKPLPADIMGASRELATRLRLLVDRAGLTLRQLAADDRVPHDVATLRRFFSGRELPPRELIEVIIERCGGDREQLLSTLDRATAAREAGFPWAAGTAGVAGTAAPRRSLRRRPGWVIAAIAGIVVVTNALTAAVIVRLTDRPSSASAAAAESAPRTPPTPSRPPTPSSAAARETSTPPPTKRPPRGYRPASREPGGNLIRNGAFTGTVTSWWPVSDVRLRADADRLRADARGGSTESWGRIVSAAAFPLQTGRTYALTFDASAGADIVDRVTVQLDYQPYTAALARDIELTTLVRRFSYRFTANVTTERATLNFELGGHSSDHTIWLDNVALVAA
jgi:hypothetical protein